MCKNYNFLLISLLVILLIESTYAGRYYDSATGRWLSIDPKADKYSEVTPYNYTLNNPLRNIDPDGKEPITLTTTGVVVGGAVTIAVVGHTYNYLTNPAYRKSYDSFTKSVIDVSGDAADNVWNTVTNWLSESESESDESSSNGGAQTKEQLEKAKGSFEGLINEHKEKLEEYKKNPENGDNKDILKNAKPEHKEKIIQGRIKAIEKQIAKQEKELEKIKESLKKFDN